MVLNCYFKARNKACLSKAHLSNELKLSLKWFIWGLHLFRLSLTQLGDTQWSYTPRNFFVFGLFSLRWAENPYGPNTWIHTRLKNSFWRTKQIEWNYVFGVKCPNSIHLVLLSYSLVKPYSYSSIFPLHLFLNHTLICHHDHLCDQLWLNYYNFIILWMILLVFSRLGLWEKIVSVLFRMGLVPRTASRLTPHLMQEKCLKA